MWWIRHRHRWSAWSDPAKEDPADLWSDFMQERYCEDTSCNVYQRRRLHSW